MPQEETRIRQDAWGLSLGSTQTAATQPWDPVLDAYARGVEQMMALDSQSPLPPDSWIWAANTHNFPFGTPVESATWATCEHASPYFLPWHRAYLVWFERTIQSLVGDPTWALPYWDYTGEDSGRLAPPPEFSVPERVVDGASVPNPLFVAGRGNPNQGSVGVVLAMTQTHYAVAAPQVGFGGSDRRGVNGMESVEMEPHNFVHGAIGGLMGSTATAGRDPLFWLHHANIDRLWEVWRRLDGSVDADSPGGLTGEVGADWKTTNFEFGADAQRLDVSAKDMPFLGTAPVNYSYDRLELTAAQLQAVKAARSAATGGGIAVEANESWTVVGASSGQVHIGEEGEEVAVELDEQQASAAAASGRPSGLIVGVEGVSAESTPHPVYRVEVAASPDAEFHYAGRFSTFGIGDDLRAGPRTFYVDASELVPVLTSEGWTGGQVLVRIAHDPENEPPDVAAAAPPELVVEQISIHQRA
jgi:hypothetical protein